MEAGQPLDLAMLDLAMLDLVMDARDEPKLPPVFRALNRLGYQPIQAMNYEVGAYAFVFAWFEGPVLKTVTVDLTLEHRTSKSTRTPGTRRRWLSRPWNAVGCLAQEALRRLRCWRQPTGLVPV